MLAIQDLPVTVEMIHIGDASQNDESIASLAARQSAGGARVVVWLDRDSPGVVWFLAAEASGQSRFKRRFQSKTSSSLDLESLAQICRSTVQVLIDLESFHEEPQTPSTTHSTATEPVASWQRLRLGLWSCGATRTQLEGLVISIG